MNNSALAGMEEAARLAELERQADKWTKSQHLRNLISAVETKAVDIIADEEEKAKSAKWITWAKQHADRDRI